MPTEFAIRASFDPDLIEPEGIAPRTPERWGARSFMASSSAGLVGRSLQEFGWRGRRRAKAQGLGPMPCRAACRQAALKMRVPVSRPRPALGPAASLRVGV